MVGPGKRAHRLRAAGARLGEPVARLRARVTRRRLQRRRFVLLLARVDGTGGVCRSVTNLANALSAAGMDVTVLALLRRRRPRYPLDPGVRLVYVRDLRPRALARLSPRQKELDSRPTALHSRNDDMTALTDRKLRRALQQLGPSTLVTHRPSLHEAAARWAPDHVVRLSVEHSTFDVRTPEDREVLRGIVPELDRLVLLTEDNKRHWADFLGSDDKLVTIPNVVPFSLGATISSWDAPVIVAAGSLIPRKGFDRLIDAFAPLASSFPDWQVRIFGKGAERPMLSRLIIERGLEGSVVLAGYTHALDEEMRSASIFAMSSHSEGLPMTVLEAMGMGLPVVAFDCTGPRQLVDHGRTGLLAPDGDIDAMTEALRTLMRSAELRAAYGRAGRDRARSYHPDEVVPRWRDVVREITS